MNLHLSEVISEVLEPVVTRFPDGNECISTEDLVARMVGVNDRLGDWQTTRWWEGRGALEGRFITCGKCIGTGVNYCAPEGEKWENPELCSCEGTKPGDGTETCDYNKLPEGKETS